MDYGFRHVPKEEDHDFLVVIYAQLFRELKVKPYTLHKWNKAGKLYSELLAKFTEAGPAYTLPVEWLRRHSEAFEPIDPETLRRRLIEFTLQSQTVAWTHIGGSETDSKEDIARIRKDWSEDRNFCYSFYCDVLDVGAPGWTDAETWVRSGYCVGGRLCLPINLLYGELLQQCTFDEFCDAYSSSSLIRLMDQKGLRDMRDLVPVEFETVLSESPRRISSVWYLKTYVMSRDARVKAHLLAPYGFRVKGDMADRERLRCFYDRLFADLVIPVLDLLDAVNKGQLFECLIKIPNFTTKDERRFLRRILKTEGTRAS
ncbi:hypothetical protein SISNIDRAFT_488680 [Sistotremastrum niveocremeum HHB9708]|uniref:Uncharacterized protein n=1 Tax=Sistotremastrum niveocremeum HHB9708 TaxID=1314777 RepID=A0A164R0S0_9AGAM|nr:hypothetical protein SISNIDRAFT_488680 [Sistotremastrum niveocremeum HHB9708]